MKQQCDHVRSCPGCLGLAGQASVEVGRQPKDHATRGARKASWRVAEAALQKTVSADASRN